MTILTATARGLQTARAFIPWKFLGEGVFSRAYRERNGERRVISLVHKDAPEKEALLRAHDQQPSNAHLPAITRLGTLADGTRAYVMPFYRPFTEKTSLGAWEAYRAVLGATWGEDAEGPEPVSVVAARYQNLAVPSELREALAALAEAAEATSPDLRFEVGHRNVAVGPGGKLVLLDLLYVPELGARLAKEILSGK